MSSKLPAPALAALLTLAAIAPQPALAKRDGAPHHTYRHGYGYRYGYGYLYQPQFYDLNKGFPPGFGASSPIPRTEPRPGRPFETDPDPHIRFEMNRDDRDRRLGGP
jgi:hypothetical protein